MRLPVFIAILLLMMSIIACGKSAEQANDAAEVAAIENYANQALAGYTAALEDARTMKNVLQAFVDAPSVEGMEKSRKAWLAARESYGPTEAFRFAGGPIDLIDGKEGPEALINAWPLDEVYVDYVAGFPEAGIINMTAQYPNLEAALLEDLNTKGGEENVSVGYHAIEFLLWGQDLSAPSEKMAGSRPYTDFVDGGTAANQDRRRAYLMICADLLLEHLGVLVRQWDKDGPYRKKFLEQDNMKSLNQMMTGLATLSKSELAGERVFTAYSNRDQEDEHSCFADNTHRDLRLNFEGISNLFFGGPVNEDNPSVYRLIATKDSVLAKAIKTKFAETREAVYATAIPFDYAITNDDLRPAVFTTVRELRKLGDLIVAGGTAIGVKVGTEL